MNILNTIMNLSWWTDLQPQTSQLFWLVFGGLAIIGILTYIYLSVISRRKHFLKAQKNHIDSWRRFLVYCVSLIGVVLFFRWQDLPGLAMRLLLAVEITGLLAWAFFLLYYRVVKYPKLIDNQKAATILEKYLPRKKGI